MENGCLSVAIRKGESIWSKESGMEPRDVIWGQWIAYTKWEQRKTRTVFKTPSPLFSLPCSSTSCLDLGKIEVIIN